MPEAVEDEKDERRPELRLAQVKLFVPCTGEALRFFFAILVVTLVDLGESSSLEVKMNSITGDVWR
jgi:hypothetical protein